MISSQAIQKISKDLIHLRRDPIDGIEIIDPESLSELKAVIRAPPSTPYENGQFMIRFLFAMDFPHSPPKAYFLTKIFHPNIDAKTGEICVNTLKKDWKATLGLRHVLLVIRCLMIEPNPDSALNAEAGHLVRENYDQFVARARMFTQIHAQKRRAFIEQPVIPPSPSQKKKMNIQRQESHHDSSCHSTTGFVSELKENNRNSGNTFHQKLTISTEGANVVFEAKGDQGKESPIISLSCDTPTSKKIKKVNKKKTGLRRL